MRNIDSLIGDILERADICAAWVAEGRELYDDPGPRGVERRCAMRMVFIEIAEAASRLPAEFRESHPEIPWADIEGMRNIVAHAYQHVNARTIWRAIAEGLPEVAEALRTTRGT